MFSGWIDEAVAVGGDLARNIIQQRFQADHIGAQNETVAGFARILDEVRAGGKAPSVAIAEITRLNDAFVSYAAGFGGRGAAGAQDVSQLAGRIIDSLRSGEVTDRHGNGGGFTLSPLMVVGALLLVFLIGGRRG